MVRSFFVFFFGKKIQSYERRQTINHINVSYVSLTFSLLSHKPSEIILQFNSRYNLFQKYIYIYIIKLNSFEQKISNVISILINKL